MTEERRVTVTGYMQGILYALQDTKKRPTAELLEVIKSYATDAIAILREPDPVKQKVGFVLLAIQQSTEVREIVNGKKTVTRVSVIDLDLYNWALSEIHKMAGVA